MRRAIGILLVLVLGACGGSKASSGHDVREFASAVAQAKVDITAMRSQFAAEVKPTTCAPFCDTQKMLADDLTRIDRNDTQYAARVAKLAAALRAVGKPDGTAAPIVSSTLARLKRITDAGALSTACSPPTDTRCMNLGDAFVKAFSDLDLIWASWHPYGV
jgi:hypothetical protein